MLCLQGSGPSKSSTLHACIYIYIWGLISPRDLEGLVAGILLSKNPLLTLSCNCFVETASAGAFLAGIFSRASCSCGEGVARMSTHAHASIVGTACLLYYTLYQCMSPSTGGSWHSASLNHWDRTTGSEPSRSTCHPCFVQRSRARPTISPKP